MCERHFVVLPWWDRLPTLNTHLCSRAEEKKKLRFIILHSLRFYINWLVTPGFKKGSRVPWISFSKQAALWEQGRAGEEQAGTWTNSKGTLSPFHPFSPSFQYRGNGGCISSVLFLHPEGLEWVLHDSGLAPSSMFLSTRDLATAIKKGRKEQDFLKKIFFFNLSHFLLSPFPKVLLFMWEVLELIWKC